MESLKKVAENVLRTMAPLFMKERMNCDSMSIVRDSSNSSEYIFKIRVYDLNLEKQVIEKTLPNELKSDDFEQQDYYLDLSEEFKDTDFLYRKMTWQPKTNFYIKVKLRQVNNKNNNFASNGSPSSQFKKKGGDDLSSYRFKSGWGTLGGLLRGENNQKYIVTNFHNFIDVNGTWENLDAKIVSPAKRNTTKGSSLNVIGSLFWYRFTDYYDLALVKIIDDKVESGTNCWSLMDHLNSDPINEGDPVKICGHQTNCSNGSGNCKGKIEAVVASKRILQGSSHIIFDCYETNITVRDGDSGSLVVNDRNTVVGILFEQQFDNAFFHDLDPIKCINEMLDYKHITFKFSQFN